MATRVVSSRGCALAAEYDKLPSRKHKKSFEQWRHIFIMGRNRIYLGFKNLIISILNEFIVLFSDIFSKVNIRRIFGNFILRHSLYQIVTKFLIQKIYASSLERKVCHDLKNTFSSFEFWSIPSSDDSKAGVGFPPFVSIRYHLQKTENVRSWSLQAGFGR